jgi:hypothetical protein
MIPDMKKEEFKEPVSKFKFKLPSVEEERRKQNEIKKIKDAVKETMKKEKD